ncbi:MAG: shikimate dehydrogenase [Pseudomonadota bacterium]
MATTPKLAAVIGWPVSHSLSPKIHATWAAREGAPAYYVPVAAEPDYQSFEKVVNGLRAAGFRGANVTMPHKENALRLAGTASDRARQANAANMLTFIGDSIHADNSDIEGFVNATRAVIEGDPTFKTAIMIGAGGAGRGVAMALKELGIKRLIVANRTREKAQNLADAFDGDVLALGEIDRALPEADIMVNTSSLGMDGRPPLEVNLQGAKRSLVVADIVYAPLQTHLLQEAAAANLTCVDGLSMLMHQAAPGYKKWLGATADVDDALRQTLVKALGGNA